MESSEHVWVCNSIQLTSPDGTKKPAPTWLLDLMSGPLAYGYVAALGGDFYGTTNRSPIQEITSPRLMTRSPPSTTPI